MANEKITRYPDDLVRISGHGSPTNFVALSNELQTITVTNAGEAEIQLIDLGDFRDIREDETQTLTLTGGAGPEDEIQTLSLSAGVENDTFKLTRGGESADPVTIPAGGFANVSAADIKTCLLTIAAWVAKGADIAVVKTDNDYAIAFSGTLGATDIGDITVTTKTGAADGSVAETNKGAAADTFKLTCNTHESSGTVTLPAGGFANVPGADIKANLLLIEDFAGLGADIAVTKDGSDYAIVFSGTLAATDVPDISVTSKTGAADGAVVETNKGIAGPAKFKIQEGGAGPKTEYVNWASNIATALQGELRTLTGDTALAVTRTDATHYVVTFDEVGSQTPFTFSDVTGFTEGINIVSILGEDIGDFTLGFDGETTAAIAADAAHGAVGSALKALPNIENADITTSGGPLGIAPVMVRFVGQFVELNTPDLTVEDDDIGGSLHTVTAVTNDGGDTRTWGTGARYALKGSDYINLDNGDHYINTGTAERVVWTKLKVVDA